MLLIISSCSTFRGNSSYSKESNQLEPQPTYFASEQNSPNRIQPKIESGKTFLDVETNVKTNRAKIVYLHNCYISGKYGEFRSLMTTYLSDGTLGDLFNERPGFCLEALAVAVKYKETYFGALLKLADLNESDLLNRKTIYNFSNAWYQKKDKRDKFVDCMRLYLNKRSLKMISKKVGNDPVLKAIF